METHDIFPLSRADILRFTQLIRKKLGISPKEAYVDIIRLMEHIIPKIYPDFTLDILPRATMREHHGLTYPNKHQILLREDVYEGACLGRGRDRFTVAHEIGQLLMHEGVDPRYARRELNQAMPKYLDPEWQSNAFAGYFLMSPEAIRGMTAAEVEVACGVSRDAATVQLSILAKK